MLTCRSILIFSSPESRIKLTNRQEIFGLKNFVSSTVLDSLRLLLFQLSNILAVRSEVLSGSFSNL